MEKEEGVITEADFREVTAARPVAYQLGKGFAFTSPEGKFQLSLGGKGQFQYRYLDKDDANGPPLLLEAGWLGKRGEGSDG